MIRTQTVPPAAYASRIHFGPLSAKNQLVPARLSWSPHLALSTLPIQAVPIGGASPPEKHSPHDRRHLSSPDSPQLPYLITFASWSSMTLSDPAPNFSDNRGSVYLAVCGPPEGRVEDFRLSSWITLQLSVFAAWASVAARSDCSIHSPTPVLSPPCSWVV
jgi:hypothetical protein